MPGIKITWADGQETTHHYPNKFETWVIKTLSWVVVGLGWVVYRLARPKTR